jgi:hypothetical protein
MKLHPLTLALLLASGAACAAEAADPQGAAVSTPSRIIVNTAGGLPLSPGDLHTFAAGTLVPNAPFSADIVTEKTQTLPDGNQILHKSVRRTFRDAAGRMRNEMLDDKGQPVYVHIVDMGEKLQYSLIPQRKTATRVNLAELTAKSGEEAHAAIIERSKSLAPGERFEIVTNVHVATAGKAAPATIERVAQIAGAELTDRKWAAQATTASLGSREIEGVKADGSATSYTIPAGAIGNQKPITVTTEKWYAPELQIIVSMKRTDPRTGETGYRVTNLKRGEQPKALFTVPEGYQVSDLGKRFNILFPNKQ